MTWQLIETAPKDETVLLLYGSLAGEIFGVTDDPVIATGYWSGGDSDYSGEDWWAVTNTDSYAVWIRATHWQPLPEPPEGQP